MNLTVLKKLPKVGIRPVIDGRRGGVRESLEEQCMNMAKRAAKLISDRLCYPDGEPVRCVISDTTIAGVAEASACEDKFRRENVGVSLTVTPCWCYGSETFDMDRQRPKAVWGFNGTERPGAVYLAAALAGYSQKGMPAFGIYGHNVQDKDDETIPDDEVEKLLAFVRAGIAVAVMRGKSYLSMGGTAMGIAGSMCNHSFWEKYLGMRVESVDMSEFAGRMKKGMYDPEEFRKALAWVKKYCREGEDRNPPEWVRSREHKDGEWEDCVKMAQIARDLMVGNPRLKDLGFEEASLGHNALLSGFQGQRNWTDYFPNGDFMEAMLNSSFDWNGRRAPYLIATENDGLNGATMLLAWLLTGTSQVFADLRTYWSPAAVERVSGYKLEGIASDGFMHFINSGSAALDGCGQMCDAQGRPAIKPFWEATDEEAAKCLDATTWYPASTGYFGGGGMSSCFKTKGGMPATMMRLNLVDGLGPVLQLAEGWTVELPDKVHHILNERTDPTWPTTWFAPILNGKGPFSSAYEVMNCWGANHCVMSCGHVGDRLITLASMLRIPVYMHNVPEERIFRPSAWRSFGTQDAEGADFRACANFGPLYS